MKIFAILEADNKVAINDVLIGETFVCQRSGKNNNKRGLYMKIGKSGVFHDNADLVLGVNLDTGLVRRFHSTKLVKVVASEIHCEKNCLD